MVTLFVATVAGFAATGLFDLIERWGPVGRSRFRFAAPLVSGVLTLLAFAVLLLFGTNDEFDGGALFARFTLPLTGGLLLGTAAAFVLFDRVYGDGC